MDYAILIKLLIPFSKTIIGISLLFVALYCILYFFDKKTSYNQKLITIHTEDENGFQYANIFYWKYVESNKYKFIVNTYKNGSIINIKNNESLVTEVIHQAYIPYNRFVLLRVYRFKYQTTTQTKLNQAKKQVNNFITGDVNTLVISSKVKGDINSNSTKTIVITKDQFTESVKEIDNSSLSDKDKELVISYLEDLLDNKEISLRKKKTVYEILKDFAGVTPLIEFTIKTLSAFFQNN